MPGPIPIFSLSCVMWGKGQERGTEMYLRCTDSGTERATCCGLDDQVFEPRLRQDIYMYVFFFLIEAIPMCLGTIKI